MTKEDIVLIAKAVATGLLEACKTMESETEEPDGETT